MLRVLFYVIILAALIYAVFWAVGRRNNPPTTGHPSTGGGSGGAPRPPRGPRGPDDDEDFLRELDRKRRQEKKPEDPA